MVVGLATFATGKTPANTTVAGRITGCRHSKQQHSWIQRVTRFWTFTVRLRKRTTHSLAGDKGYDWIDLPEKLREEGVRPLIKHREFREFVLMCTVHNIKQSLKP
ncbi:hypothetical protein Halar_1983 [halophilic archaeon DL31]|jgi:hypothetical protein|nr:hypothetical protein Halar_1983 [halophilic archaeon DL31]